VPVRSGRANVRGVLYLRKVRDRLRRKVASSYL
jgi:hypothetical protein